MKAVPYALATGSLVYAMDVRGPTLHMQLVL